MCDTKFNDQIVIIRFLRYFFSFEDKYSVKSNQPIVQILSIIALCWSLGSLKPGANICQGVQVKNLNYTISYRFFISPHF